MRWGRIDKQRVSAGKQLHVQDTVDEIERHDLARSFLRDTVTPASRSGRRGAESATGPKGCRDAVLTSRCNHWMPLPAVSL